MDHMNEKWQQLKDWIQSSGNIVFFGGAGVSTESGIPDFRSVDGLYNQQYKYPPETIISHSFYVRNPEEFYRFYKDRMLLPMQSPMQPIRPWRDWRNRENSGLSLHRTLTGCIRWREVKRSWSFTAPYIGIIVPDDWRILQGWIYGDKQ